MTLHQLGSIKLNAKFESAIKLALLQLAPLLLLTTMLLDGGRLFQLTLMISLAYCAGVMLIAMRRRDKSTRLDLWFMKWSPVPTLLVAMALDAILYR